MEKTRLWDWGRAERRRFTFRLQEGALKSSKAMEMEGEEVGNMLPEDLVEKIVAMVPFPSIVRAQRLSKSWRAKFSAASAHEDEERKCLVVSFHRQVGEWSRNWTSFCPIFIGRKDLIAYDSASQNWLKLSSLSFLPEPLFHVARNTGQGFLDRSQLQFEGGLLYGFARSLTGFYEYDLYVANILTRSWKQLPPRPKAGLSFVLCNKLVSDMSSNKYKVVLFCQDDCLDDFDHYSAQIYDSKSNLWSTQKFVVTCDFFQGASASAFLDGVLYMVAVNNPQNLLAFNLVEGTLKEIVLSCNERIDIVTIHLLVCNANRLFMVSRGLHPDSMQVLKVDLGSLRLVQLSQGPPPPVHVRKIFAQPVSDGNCIYFRVEELGTRVLAYNVDEDLWTSFPAPSDTNARRTYKWIGSSFQPGLNPFVAV